MSDDIQDTLDERGARYGSFETHAEYAEAFNRIYESSPNWKTMKPDAKEALRIIANKVGRILNGDPEFHDSWWDIVGYAQLVADRIKRDQSSRIIQDFVNDDQLTLNLEGLL